MWGSGVIPGGHAPPPSPSFELSEKKSYPSYFSTWGHTKAQDDSLDQIHRGQLRRMFRISWKDKVSNENLYMRAHSGPISLNIRKKQMKTQERRPEDIPANQDMRKYF